MNNFTKKLKQLRWSQNMTIEEFANSLSINQNTYKGYDGGYRRPTIKLLQRLVLVYGINLNEWIMEVNV